MKTSKSDSFFGLEEFNQLRKKFKNKIKNKINPKTDDTNQNDTVSEISINETDNISDSSENIEPEIKNTNEISTPVNTNRTEFIFSLKEAFSTKSLISLIIFLIISLTITSIITIKLKIRKKELSYKLAKQTTLMKRLSQKKAVFELEYAFLKSNENIKEYAKKYNWIHVSPKDIIFISNGKKSDLTKRKNKILIKTQKNDSDSKNNVTKKEKSVLNGIDK